MSQSHETRGKVTLLISQPNGGDLLSGQEIRCHLARGRDKIQQGSVLYWQFLADLLQPFTGLAVAMFCPLSAIISVSHRRTGLCGFPTAGLLVDRAQWQRVFHTAHFAAIPLPQFPSSIHTHTHPYPTGNLQNLLHLFLQQYTNMKLII